MSSETCTQQKPLPASSYQRPRLRKHGSWQTLTLVGSVGFNSVSGSTSEDSSVP